MSCCGWYEASKISLLFDLSVESTDIDLLHTPGNGWTCDWPGHEGRNGFTQSDPLYGCATIMKCQFGVCQKCWNDIAAAEAVAKKQAAVAPKVTNKTEATVQLNNTYSRYNADYYCEVKRVVTRTIDNGAVEVVLTFNIRGDGSLGALQEPQSSHLLIGSTKLTCTKAVIATKDIFQITGELIYTISVAMKDNLLTEKIGFVFGQSGYTTATLQVPNSINAESVPLCGQNHKMVESDFHGGGYATGYVCNKCRKSKKGSRWLCQGCQDDYCFDCVPSQSGATSTTATAAVSGAKSKAPPVCTNRHVMEISDYRGGGYATGYVCNKCRKSKTGSRWLCKACQDDYCLSCEPKR